MPHCRALLPSEGTKTPGHTNHHSPATDSAFVPSQHLKSDSRLAAVWPLHHQKPITPSFSTPHPFNPHELPKVVMKMFPASADVRGAVLTCFPF
jgi:hypothetical protein